MEREAGLVFPARNFLLVRRDDHPCPACASPIFQRQGLTVSTSLWPQAPEFK